VRTAEQTRSRSPAQSSDQAKNHERRLLLLPLRLRDPQRERFQIKRTSFSAEEACGIPRRLSFLARAGYVVVFMEDCVARRKNRRAFAARVVLARPARLGLLVLLLSVGSCAQQEPKDLSQASLEELTSIQVYSASKHMQSVSEAPASVTVVTADEIQKYGYRTLAEILQSVRGFYITFDRDYIYVGVRGFGRLGDWNSRILLLVDGHRINDNILGQAMLGTEFLVDVDLIERVEIIRGPSSSLYGADAFFAVINVITRKPPQLKGVELSLEPASFGTYQSRASYGGQYRGVDMLLSGTFYNSQGQTLFYPQFDSPATNNGITRNTDQENSQHTGYHQFSRLHPAGIVQRARSGSSYCVLRDHIQRPSYSKHRPTPILRSQLSAFHRRKVAIDRANIL
jgi:outer membrane receptor protein involved in Fe transport